MSVPAAAREYDAAMISAAQIRAARQLLGWKQTDLSDLSGVSLKSIKNVELEIGDPRSSTLAKIEAAFTEAGIVFLSRGDTRGGGPGVRLAE